MTYEETLSYIHSVSWKGSRPGLERITELMHKLGDPQNSLRFIHVAGTNGKGSFCSMLSSVLSEAGYKVGMFTSPFVECFNERIMYCGRNISDDELTEVVSYIKPFADSMTDTPTEFELITAVALVYYAKKACDYVVFECGLGGRLDSTNVISTPVLSVITGIDLDHTALLGDTTEKIAAEKAGIIKRGVPVLFGEGDRGAAEVIRNRAEEMRSDFYRTPYDKIGNVRTKPGSTSFEFDGGAYNINLCGLYQTKNAANVICAVQILRSRGVDISDEALKSGLEKARWKARFETLSQNPLIIYDGAHNPQGICAAVENIKVYLSPLTADGKVALLMGVMADKAHGEMIKTLSPCVDRAFTVTPSNARSLDSDGVRKEFESCGVPAEAFDKLSEGVAAAVAYAKESGRPLICLGSLYMYADVKKAVISCI